MDQQELALFLCAAPDDLILGFAEAAVRDLTDSFTDDAGFDAPRIIATAQVIHAHLIWRNYDADALDLFTRMNALVKDHVDPQGMLQDMAYSDYVGSLIRNNPFYN
jgi:hypothetical protein